MSHIEIETTPQFEAVDFRLIKVRRDHPELRRSFKSREGFKTFILSHFSDALWQSISDSVVVDPALRHRISVAIQIKKKHNGDVVPKTLP